VAGEKMNLFADFENREFQIETRKSIIERQNSQIQKPKFKIQDHPITQWPDDPIPRPVASGEQESRKDSGEERGAGGKKQKKGEGGKAGNPTLTIKRAAHTSPHRLSTGAGENMNQFAAIDKKMQNPARKGGQHRRPPPA
jgi:hypothetical protein